jgi:hypothetical protein
MRRKNPCQPECPGRSAECHATCPHWAEYEKEKFDDYKEREKLMAAEQDLNEHIKYSMRRRRRKKRE